MEASMKRRYALMAAAFIETEDDDDFLSGERNGSCWIKEWMEHKSRGIQNQLYEELLQTDPDEYRRLLRVPRDVFMGLLARIRHRVEKQDTNMRRSISAKTRLQVTLRYLASGVPSHCGTAGNQEADQLAKLEHDDAEFLLSSAEPFEDAKLLVAREAQAKHPDARYAAEDRLARQRQAVTHRLLTSSASFPVTLQWLRPSQLRTNLFLSGASNTVPIRAVRLSSLNRVICRIFKVDRRVA
ncbi:hypothetical protein HPB47_014845 [Ixodes persulcatus]|uniref:Uncharacterized protein n=1 Tax=Ixodes persulcatus TaxID=34615 RepID=A0AC60QV00_IXOPE|nr:hypothetical protein HPB47_014845 [Ixodes persulcatus]